jgi:hypothetical protein
MVTKLRTTLFCLLIRELELSYMLYHVEQNGRSHGEPWSLRKFGVYRRVNVQTQNSAWIFLNLSASARRQLESTLEKLTVGRNESFDEIHPHLLQTTADNWGRYIEYLACQLRNIVRGNAFLPLFIYGLLLTKRIGRKSLYPAARHGLGHASAAAAALTTSHNGCEAQIVP